MCLPWIVFIREIEAMTLDEFDRKLERISKVCERVLATPEDISARQELHQELLPERTPFVVPTELGPEVDSLVVLAQDSASVITDPTVNAEMYVMALRALRHDVTTIVSEIFLMERPQK